MNVTTERPTSERRWNHRAFVVLGAALSGLALPITGLADHAARQPLSSDAAAGWALVHTSLGIMFVAFCTWHVVLNRRALLRYLRGKAAARGVPTKEVVAALALVGIVMAVTVTHALVEA
jgi:uncharacterized membrane protein